MKKNHSSLSIAAILSIIIGFGMIHSSTGNREIISILLIGAGTTYLFYRLLKSRNKEKDS